MPKLPSIKTLNTAFPGHGAAMRKLLESPNAVYAHPVAERLERQSYAPVKLSALRLAALNAEAGTFGVEYVPPGHNQRSPGFHYLNTGETYAPTLVRYNSGRYAVTSWGDIVERGRYD